MAKVKMIIVGGFLGAGKTTLLAKAAENLAGRGVKVGLITNDQAVNLVDTGVLQQAGQEVKEVAGACFCCAFNRLLYVCDELIATFNPDIIIGEPVGSCTDLSATVLQPMKKLCRDTFDLSPFTVLIDPAEFLKNIREDGSTLESVRYIYRKQIEEADLIVVNKADTLSTEAIAEVESLIRTRFPGIPTMTMAAAEGRGVDEWLDVILAGGKVGQRIAEVDYDTYADGEAALGWLNAAVRLRAASPINWKAFGMDLMERMQTRLVAASAQIAHLKILLTSQGGKLKMSITSNSGTPSAEGAAPSSPFATLVINARVRANPEELKAIVERCVKDAAGKAMAADIVEITSFRPSRPNPVHRFTATVEAGPLD
jgi:G3E family GTPase